MKEGKGKKIVGNLLSFASGFIGKSNPIAGIVIPIATLAKDKIVQHLKKNKASEIGGEGKTDFAEIAGIAAFVVLAAAGLFLVVKGYITTDDLFNLLEAFEKANG